MAGYSENELRRALRGTTKSTKKHQAELNRYIAEWMPFQAAVYAVFLGLADDDPSLAWEPEAFIDHWYAPQDGGNAGRSLQTFFFGVEDIPTFSARVALSCMCWAFTTDRVSLEQELSKAGVRRRWSLRLDWLFGRLEVYFRELSRNEARARLQSSEWADDAFARERYEVLVGWLRRNQLEETFREFLTAARGELRPPIEPTPLATARWLVERLETALSCLHMWETSDIYPFLREISEVVLFREPAKAWYLERVRDLARRFTDWDVEGKEDQGWREVMELLLNRCSEGFNMWTDFYPPRERTKDLLCVTKAINGHDSQGRARAVRDLLDLRVPLEDLAARLRGLPEGEQADFLRLFSDCRGHDTLRRVWDGLEGIPGYLRAIVCLRGFHWSVEHAVDFLADVGEWQLDDGTYLTQVVQRIGGLPDKAKARRSLKTLRDRLNDLIYAEGVQDRLLRLLERGRPKWVEAYCRMQLSESRRQILLERAESQPFSREALHDLREDLEEASEEAMAFLLEDGEQTTGGALATYRDVVRSPIQRAREALLAEGLPGDTYRALWREGLMACAVRQPQTERLQEILPEFVRLRSGDSRLRAALRSRALLRRVFETLAHEGDEALRRLEQLCKREEGVSANAIRATCSPSSAEDAPRSQRFAHRRLIVVGDFLRPEQVETLQRRAEVPTQVWPREKQRVYRFQPRDVVTLYTGHGGHDTSDSVKRACERDGAIFVRTSIRNPELLAEIIRSHLERTEDL